ERLCWQGSELTHRGTYGRAAAGRICERLADEVLVCTGADCDDLGRTTRRLEGASSRAAVASGHGHNKARIDRIVEPGRTDVLAGGPAAAFAGEAANRQIENVHPVGDCG